MIETTSELLALDDPFPARAAALGALARCGVPFEALRRLRAATRGRERSVIEWLRVALEEAERWQGEAA